MLQFAEPLEPSMSCMRRVPRVQTTPTGELLQSGMEHAFEEAVLEALMEVAHRPQLFPDPAPVHALLELAERIDGVVAGVERIECGLCREHAALDRQVDTLQPLRIEEAGRVAHDHPAIATDGRDRPPAAIWQRLRAIADHLAAL